MKTKKTLILTSLFLMAFLFINFVTNQNKTNNKVTQSMGKICSYIEANKKTNLSIDTTFTVSNYKSETVYIRVFNHIYLFNIGVGYQKRYKYIEYVSNDYFFVKSELMNLTQSIRKYEYIEKENRVVCIPCQSYKLKTFLEQTFFKTSQPNDTLLLLIHSDMRPI